MNKFSFAYRQGMSTLYTMWYVAVDLPQTKSIHFALTESKDGSTNITWEIIEQIVDVIAIWRKQREKSETVFTKPW